MATKKTTRAGVGAQGENIAEIFFALCKDLFTVWRIPNDFQVVGRKFGRIMVVPKRKSGPDYMGLSHIDGRNVAFEVKNLGSKALTSGKLEAPRLAFQYIEDHQLQDMMRIHMRTGLALFLVVHGNPWRGGALYAVPPYVVLNAKAKGALSLKAADLAPYAVKSAEDLGAIWSAMLALKGRVPRDAYRGDVKVSIDE